MRQLIHLVFLYEVNVVLNIFCLDTPYWIFTRNSNILGQTESKTFPHSKFFTIDELWKSGQNFTPSKIFRLAELSSLPGNFVTYVRQSVIGKADSFLYLVFCLLRAVVDPMKEGYTKAVVDFLISDLLKRALTKHKKKTTETSVNFCPLKTDFFSSLKTDLFSLWSFKNPLKNVKVAKAN